MLLYHRIDPGPALTPIMLGVMTSSGVDLGDPPSGGVVVRLYEAAWWADTTPLPVIVRLHQAGPVPSEPPAEPEPEPVTVRLHAAGPVATLPLPDPDPEPEPDPVVVRLHQGGPVNGIPIPA